MAAGGGTQSGRFHLKCSSAVRLSENGAIAWTKSINAFGMVFSKEPIPKGHKFSVKVLKPAVVSSTWPPFLGIGVTTKGPISGPVLEKLDDFMKADHYWYVKIDNPVDAVQYKGQQGRLPWVLAYSEGKTAGCWVSDKGKFYIYTRESDVGDEMGEGLPTDKPLWGFVAFRREWKVEANYKVAIPKGRPQLAAPADCPKGSSPVQLKPKRPAGHPQDYAGKTFHFVERPPEWLMCAVCHALAHDPVQAKCCGKIYCSQCIATWKTKSNSCPTCRREEQSDPPFNVSEDKNARQQIISLFVYCPKWKEGCDKKMELSEVKSHFTSNNCFLLQRMECEYKRFGCAIVLPRKDMAEHLKTSVEAHLQMTKRRMEEQEVRLQEQEVRLQEEHQLLEVQLRKMEEMAKKHETRLKDVEEKAERERQKLKEAIACNVEQMEERAKKHETRLNDAEESKLMKEKMHRTNTLMRWLLICVPALLLVTAFIGYHQGLWPPIAAIILSYLLGLFTLIHYRVL